MKAKKLIALILSVTLCITMLPERVLSQFIGAFSTSAYATSDDPYVDTFGITENQLYTTYPDYLSESFVMDKLREYNVEIIKIGNSGDSTTNTIIYSLGNGLSFLSTEAMAALGMGESTEEKVCDAVVKKIATELSRDESVSYSYLKTELSIIDIAVGKTFDLATAADVNRLEKELQKLPQISKEKANAMVQQTKDNGSFMKASVNGAVTISELIIQAAEIESLNSQLLYDIFEYFEFNNQTELADAAWRLYKKSEEDFGKRMLDIYLTDAAANTFADIIKDTVMSSKVTMICSITYKMLELGKVVSDIKDILGANYSSIAASCAYYHMDKLLEKSKKQMLTDSEIEDYKFSYSLCNAALVTGFGYAKECAATKDLRVDASSYQAIVRGAFTYDKYIKGCMSLYKNAKDNGQLKTASYADSSKKVTTTITPEKSYENILERFQKIQSVYPPNAGVQYLAGGECFGFAKMVFFNLFGVSLPGCYLGSAKYEYTSSETVEIVGQLTGADVTVSNLADLFSKAKLGDIIQACGRDFEQHTMVFVNYSDKGLTLYDCNFRYTDASVEDYGSCFVHQRTYSLSEFAGWYDNVGTYDVANGVTLYHATNYEYIYGGEDVIFYDDSVNFVISDGVLTKYNGSQKYVEIPAEVTSIGANAFKNNDYIISVAFPDGLTSIGDNAFYDCDNLAAVVMPDSVTTIGNSAFDSCDNLGYLYLSSELTEIGRYAFANCASLTDFLLPSKISILNVGAFHNCDSITSISIPSTLNKAYTDSYTGVGGTKYYGVFSGCDNLEHATFSDKCTAVIDNIFFRCNGLKKVDIPNTVTSIGNRSFEECISLEQITIPESVTTIGSSAFYNCNSLTEIGIPDGVKVISKNTFYNCQSIKKVRLPNTITLINSRAFYNCDALVNIKIPENVIAIDDSAFNNCDSLTAIKMGNVKFIGSQAFYDCDALESVEISAVHSIGSEAFRDCDSLISIKLGEYVNTIGASAFRKLPKLTNISIPSPVASISDYAFAENVKLSDVHIPSSAVTISDTAFSYPDIMTIHAANGSAAATYADDWEFEFEPDDYDLSIKPTVSNIRPYSLTLTWDSVTGVDKYSVSYLDSNNIFRTAAEDISSTSYTITGLAQYTNYKVLVRGLKNGRCSDYTTSDFVSTRTAQGAGDITTLTAEPSETSVVLSWTSSSSANGYIIYQLDASGNWIEIARTNSSTRKYTVTGLVSGIKYTFAVCGYKNIGSEAVPGQKTQTTVATPDSTQVANCVGHSLTLTSGIGIKYYIEFSDQVKSDAGAYIKFTLPDSSTETHSVNIAETAIVNGKNVYVFTCNVSAAEMSDIIKTELILSSGDSVYLSDYSIKAYADHILANANSNEEFAKAAPVVKAMLNYGAYSQIFFKHNIDNLANSNMTDTALSNVTSSDISSYKYSVSDNDANIDFVGQVITLKSKVNAKLYFTTNNSAALTKEQVVIKQGSIAIDPSRIIIGTDESGMYISITDICVDDYDDAFEIAVGNVSIKNYSIYSYIYMALESKDINLINVARSLFDYNRAVETFAS